MSKFRSDFVTNSSSSSFVLQSKKITKKQIAKILSFIESSGDFWTVTFSGTVIKGDTFMDNAMIGELFKKMKLNPKHYTIEEG